MTLHPHLTMPHWPSGAGADLAKADLRGANLSDATRSSFLLSETQFRIAALKVALNVQL